MNQSLSTETIQVQEKCLKQEIINRVAEVTAKIDGEIAPFPHHYKYGEEVHKIVVDVAIRVYKQVQDEYPNQDSNA